MIEIQNNNKKLDLEVKMKNEKIETFNRFVQELEGKILKIEVNAN